MVFFSAGTTMSAWAPLVPFAKRRLDLEPSQLGLVLLCLGIGSILTMPMTGALVARFGCRPIIVLAGVLACLLLPMLMLAPSPWTLAGALFVFGAGIGTLDVAMNIQAVQLEKDSGIALNAGFHGMYSVGGIAGSGAVALLLSMGFGTMAASALLAAMVIVLLGVASPHLLGKNHATAGAGAAFAVPHGAVIYLGALCFFAFLAEGAVLDWSALILTAEGALHASQGGLGYSVFSVAMAAGRLNGDRIIRRWGRKRILFVGGLGTAAGFFTTVMASSAAVSLAGFLLIGIGVSNMAPIFFTAAGRQHQMPVGLAVSAITTLGYAGVLTGPAVIGFIARASSLQVAYAAVGCAMLMVAGSARSRVIA